MTIYRAIGEVKNSTDGTLIETNPKIAEMLRGMKNHAIKAF